MRLIETSFMLFMYMIRIPIIQINQIHDIFAGIYFQHNFSTGQGGKHMY